MKITRNKIKKTRARRQASTGSKQISFLPEPELNCNPRWPKKNTHLSQTLCLMLQGREITALDFQDESSSQRLPVHIDILCNKLGWPVLREDIIIRMKKKPKLRSFRKYYFDKKFIIKIKKISGGVL